MSIVAGIMLGLSVSFEGSNSLRHAKGKALFQQFARHWLDAVLKARKELGIKGFCAVGGKSAQGKALYAKAKALYAA